MNISSNNREQLSHLNLWRNRDEQHWSVREALLVWCHPSSSITSFPVTSFFLCADAEAPPPPLHWSSYPATIHYWDRRAQTYSAALSSGGKKEKKNFGFWSKCGTTHTVSDGCISSLMPSGSPGQCEAQRVIRRGFHWTVFRQWKVIRISVTQDHPVDGQEVGRVALHHL